MGNIRSNQWVIYTAVFLLCALVLASQSGVLPVMLPMTYVMVAGLLVLTAIMAFASGVFTGSGNRQLNWLKAQEQHSPYPVIVADADGQVIFSNPAAHELVAIDSGAVSIITMLAEVLADPRPVVFRLQERLKFDPCVRECFQTNLHEVEIIAQRISHKQFLWRIYLRPKLIGQSSGHSKARISLSVGRNGAILASSDEFDDLFTELPKNINAILNPSPQDDAGFGRLRTQEGDKTCFYLASQPRAGRQDISIYLYDDLIEGGRQILDALPMPVLELATDGTVIFTNQATGKMLGDECPIGKHLGQYVTDTGRSISDWLRQVNSGEDAKPEFARLTMEDSDRFVQMSLTRMELGERAFLFAFLSDATELKSLEAQFVQSQKMQAIGQLAGGVAHDFNNLLTAISGHCDLLLLRRNQSDPDFGDLDQIRQNSNRAASLVGQLLAFSRKQTLQQQDLDLERVLSAHTHLLNRLVGEKTSLHFVHGPKLKPIRADKRQLEQVIMNLVVNARDAMNGEGVITIETTMRRLTHPMKKDRATVPAGEYCVVSVSDQGCGIPADKVQRIFEPFYTSKKTGEGTGLGLSTVYGIVKQTGGFVFVDSAVGVGSTFEIFFPVSDFDPVEAVAENLPAEYQSLSEKSDGVVLLVEDEAPVRAFASRALRLKGFRVIEASNAEEALEILTDQALLVDVFVTDVVMPGRDGPSWVSEALQTRPDTKVVFVSGYAENRCDELGKNIPNSVFLPKPFSLAQLTSTVAQIH